MHSSTAQACPPSIKDARGATVKKTAGPYAEGDTVRLTCEIETCDHDVTLTWYHNGTQLRSSRGTVATSDGGWKNLVTLGPLTRRDLHSNVTCLATSNVSLPGVASVLLDLYLPPTAVTIWSWPAQQTDTPRGSLEFSSAATQHSLPTKTAAIATTFGPGLALSHREANGREATAAMSVGSRSGFSKPRSFECEATGSRPAANITWLLDGIAVDPAFIRSVSAGQRDHQHAPTAGVRSVGTAFGVPSNQPKPTRKQRDAEPLPESGHVAGSLGTTVRPTPLVTPRYLVIRGVTADHSGRYTCTANTADGEIVESVPLELRVRHAPRCGVRRDKVLAARPNEQLNVTCDVTADPDEGLHFFWIAEDDAGNRRHVTRAEAAQDAQSGERLPELRRSNQLEVLVDAHLFHATLLCWARNAVGTQRDPCRHRFELRREPASSLDCTIGNYTDTSFSITCASRQHGRARSGEEHGAKATKTRLRIELFDAAAGNRSVRGFWVTTTENGRDPLFLTGLRPATEYLVLARLETEANAFTTYVRTLVTAQTLREREELVSTEKTATLPP
ncbi:hypothetical protein MTO96_004089 [Rhipicephalus appendiculatus]